MKSWVRYSVAVYLGFLLGGALIAPGPEAAARYLRLTQMKYEQQRALNGGPVVWPVESHDEWRSEG